MKAKVKWIENMKFVSYSDSNHSILMDTEEDVGGDDSASRPMEFCLMSLLGCTGMDVVSIMRKMEIEWNSFEVEATEITRSSKHPKVFKSINLLFKIKGKNISEKLFAKAIRLSQEKYCPVTAMLNKSVKITYDYKIN